MLSSFKSAKKTLRRALAGAIGLTAVAAASAASTQALAGEQILLDCVYTAALNPGIKPQGTIIGRHFKLDINDSRVLEDNRGFGDDAHLTVDIGAAAIHYQYFISFFKSQSDVTIDRVTGVYSEQLTDLTTMEVKMRPQRAACTKMALPTKAF